MKISYNWLKTLLPVSLSASETAVLLTDAGLEVEGIEEHETVKGGLQGLVIGEVKECAKHPDADRLSVTKVDIGEGRLLDIVCGAPNVAAGQKVVVASVGAKLFPSTGEPFEIKKSKIRGAVSEGMLCAEDEIGLGASHAGIMVLPPNIAVGTPASEYFKIEKDHVFEIGLTPNRSDAASHLGVARDLAAILNSRNNNDELQITIPGKSKLADPTNTVKVAVHVEVPQACRRYSGIVLSGLQVAESPGWLKNRLSAIGLRPINNVVDVTNFVLHELGQPLHAFDLEKIAGSEIRVRYARENETFVTLDEVSRSLSGKDLVIADKNEVMCIAGVFGGQKSGVTSSTKSIFLESAYFDPSHVRMSSKKHGLKTDASFRFERGTDPEMTVTALERAAQLIVEIAGGTVSTNVTDLYPDKLEPYRVAFSFQNCRDLIGKDIDRGTIRQIITNLGMKVETEGNDGLLLSVPLYKSDVTREADVIEEVMRVYGFNLVEESRQISYTAIATGKNPDNELEEKIGTLLTGIGYSEMIGLSLTSSSHYADESKLVKVLNPLSNDLNVMRQNLLFGGLQALAHNINRKNADLKLYEIGRTYSQVEGSYEENKMLSIFVSGNLFPANAHGLEFNRGFAYLKATVESILKKCGVNKFELTEPASENYHAGIAMIKNGKILGEMGKVSKDLLKKADIHQEVFHATINWSQLLKLSSKQQIEFSELIKFPSVRRDLALLIDRKIKYAEIEALAFATEKKFLQEVNLFDVYEGEKLGNKKSYAVSFTLQNSEATLTDKQIDAVMEKLISTYRDKLGAELR